MERFKLNLQLFTDYINATTSNTSGVNDLSPEMKTFYDKDLLRLAEPYLVHDMFGQKRPIPRNGGKTIEFRQFTRLPKITDALVEGVAPDGQALNVTAKTATVIQMGGFVKVTDLLQLTSIDPVITETTRLIASQAGRSLDTITRDIINAGSNVLYCNSKTNRGALTSSDKLTVTDVRKAVRALESQDAPKINGDHYVAIIHPDVAYDLMSDSTWVDWQKYTTPEHMYNNEIGRIANVRFVQSTEAKKFALADVAPISGSNKYVTYASVASKVITISETLTSAEQTAAVGRYVLLDGKPNKITAAAANTITVENSLVASLSAGDKIYLEGAGAAGATVYSTLIIGADAYGVTEVTGGGLETVIKDNSKGGPLNQYATVGWKAVKTAERLIENYMIRVESGNTWS